MGDDDGKVMEVPFGEHARARREVQAEIAAVNWLLIHYAGELPAESPTAKAIGRGASWQEIEALARWEEADAVVALLDDAHRVLGPDLPAVVDRSAEATSLKATLIPLSGAAGPQAAGGAKSEHPSGDER